MSSGAQGATVCAVTVTYGDRLHLLERVIEALERERSIASICVVDNGATEDTKRYLSSLRERTEAIHIVTMPRNTGSAGGFGAGLRCALERTSCDHIWLLDDDNVPAPDALRVLLDTCGELGDHRDHVALSSYRPNRPEQEKLTRGVGLDEVFPLRSSFLSLHVRDAPKKIWRRITSRRESVPPRAGGRPKTIAIPFTVYGGLLLSRATVESIGFPDARFFTYADDTEYTYRITAAGGEILLVPSSIVEDVDTSWDSEASGTFLPMRLLQSDSDFRVFYNTRNQVYFSRYRWCDKTSEYLLNRWLFQLVLRAGAAIYRRADRYRLIRRAIRAGEREDFRPFREV